MSIHNYNTTSSTKNQYHHLTKDDRIKIETLISLKDENGKRIYNNTYIANLLGVHKSTISRELRKRIKSKLFVKTDHIKNLPYSANHAHQDYLFKRALSKANYIIEKYPKMKKFIEDKILIDGWDPDAIVGFMEKNQFYLKPGFCSLSTPTVYRAIHYGLLKVKKQNTRRMLKFQHSQKDCVKKDIPINKKDFSIELRPDNINQRTEFGHFELDTVIGSSKGNHQCLLTFTEKLTRFEFIFRLEAKTKQSVIHKFNLLKKYLKKDFSSIFKSITTDNGSEFAGFHQMIDNTNSSIFFCHPYCSGEKGSNEKNNSMIRYFIPKGSLIEHYSNEQINSVAFWMNHYPRKIFHYSTSYDEFVKYIKNKKILTKLLSLQEIINS